MSKASSVGDSGDSFYLLFKGTEPLIHINTPRGIKTITCDMALFTKEELDGMQLLSSIKNPNTGDMQGLIVINSGGSSA